MCWQKNTLLLTGLWFIQYIVLTFLWTTQVWLTIREARVPQLGQQKHEPYLSDSLPLTRTQGLLDWMYWLPNLDMFSTPFKPSRSLQNNHPYQKRDHKNVWEMSKYRKPTSNATCNETCWLWLAYEHRRIFGSRLSPLETSDSRKYLCTCRLDSGCLTSFSPDRQCMFLAPYWWALWNSCLLQSNPWVVLRHQSCCGQTSKLWKTVHFFTVTKM